MTDVVEAPGVDELTLEVTHAAGRLAGSAEAAAVLESIGVGDERARRLDQANVFRLAAEIAERQDRAPEAVEASREAEAVRRKERLARHGAPRPVARGLGLAVPLVAPALAIPLLTASLWNGGQAEAERATAIGLAVAASFIAVAGFVLAIATAGWGPRTGGMTRTTVRLAALGLGTAVLSGLALWGVLSWKDFVAPAEVGTAIQYFAMLALLWLAGGLAMAAGRTGWASLALPVGIAVGVVLRVGLDLSLVGAQSAGILTAAAIAALAALTAAQNGYRRVRTPLAHRSALVALVLVGTAVGGMLFADRLATWYSQRPFHSWILRLQPDAEAGWDWAVVAVFGVVAVAASAAARYWSNVARVADRTPLTAGRAMSEEIRTSHRRTVRRLVIAGAIGAAISFVGVVTWMALSTSFSEVVSRDTAFVFAVVGPGLVLLSWGALNAAVLLAMGRPDVAVLAAWLGLLVDAAVALPLSAHADGWTASVGLLAGALVFLLVGLGPVRKVLRNADLVFATRA